MRKKFPFLKIVISFQVGHFVFPVFTENKLLYRCPNFIWHVSNFGILVSFIHTESVNKIVLNLTDEMKRHRIHVVLSLPNSVTQKW